MAELKRNFSGAQGAKMNKDLDERIIPPGQYRDALNIEISTSESSNAGTAQNIKGNTKRSTMAGGTDTYYDIPDTATVVGSVAALNTDKVYYLVSAGGSNTGGATPSISKDYIMEYDPILNVHKYVFVDIYKVKTTNEALTTITDNFLHIPVTAQDAEGLYGPEVNATGVRVGMRLGVDTIYDSSHGVEVTDIQKIATTVGTITTWTWKVSFNKTLTSVISEGADIVFYANSPRVLNFNAGSLITGINILDDFIYWTDNNSEPKKINIPRSIAGTGGFYYLNLDNLFSVYGALGYDHSWASAISATNATVFTGDTNYFHTRLVKGEGTNLRVITKSGLVSDVLTSNRKAVWAEEKHITVIKKGPTQPLELQLYSTVAPRFPDGSEVENPLYGIIPALDISSPIYGQNSLLAGDELDITFETPKDFRIGDILQLTANTSSTGTFVSGENYSLRVKILEDADGEGPSDNPNNNQLTFKTLILSIRSDISNSLSSFKATIEQGDSLFEFKFPRFSYRYKYQDGEYSTFAPWSRIAFLPGEYNFSSAEGWNKGMSNRLRNLKVKGYHAGEERMMEDVVEIDILYKETNNPTVYTVTTITSEDNTSNRWPSIGELDGIHEQRGSLDITSDMIHEVVPSNQLLRPWDNVPRIALGQEVSANRLVYGNYLQNYDVPIEPSVTLGFESKAVTGDYAGSVKTLRDYSVGVVFSDEYGRETPVVFNSGSDNGIKIPKEASDRKNRLLVSLSSNSAIPTWAKYFSYYVKEPSIEYYNLIMDRWWSTEDGNLWLSFPSSERNKVDEETFLVLKKKNGSDLAARGSSKYKINAIENNAPDYIKNTLKPINIASAADLGNGVDGFPIEDATFFTLPAAYGQLLVTESAPRLAVRFSANSYRSKIYYITNVSGTGVDPYHFHIEGKFKADVSFLTDFTNVIASAVDNIDVQFYSIVPENKPEFAGRFFVKINKDAELEQYLLGVSEVEEVSILDTWKVRYVNNNGYDYWDNGVVDQSVPSDPKYVVSSQSQEDTGGGMVGLYSNHDKHPTEFDYHNNEDGTGTTVYKWNFDDNGPLAVTSAAIREDPVAAINDATVNVSAKTFWNTLRAKEDFFIDGATAYSWSSYNPTQEGFTEGFGDPGTYGSGNYFEFQDSYSDTMGTYWWPDWTEEVLSNDPIGGGSGGWQDDDQEGLYSVPWYNSIYTTSNSEVVNSDVSSMSPPFGGTGNIAANMKQGMGLPSRAIRNTTILTDWGDSIDASYMDISWVGTHANEGPQIGNAQVDHRLGQQDPSGASFIQKLTTPGARFRFQRDPDETIYVVQDYSITEEGYYNTDFWKTGSSNSTGAFGIRNYRPPYLDSIVESPRSQFWASNMRQRWSLVVTPRIGSGTSGYNPITGTKDPTDGVGPTYDDSKYRRALHHDATDSDVIEIVNAYNTDGSGFVPNGAVFETKPKESADIDIYYQASGLIPLQLDDKTNEEYLPLGTTFKVAYRSNLTSPIVIHSTHTITEWTDAETIKFTPALPNNVVSPDTNLIVYAAYQSPYGIWGSGHEIVFTKRGNYSLTARMRDAISTVSTYGSVSTNGGYTWTAQTEPIDTIRLHGARQANNVTVSDAYKLYSQKHYLDWNNCWAFGNGVESDRIRDDYNAPQMDNGVKASSVLETKVKEERRKHGLIWSGIYNSTSGINDTNQFIAAEKITKDINPIYGSIQKLYNRGTQLLMFCEDKVLRADTNRDLLFNADGSSQVISSTAVIGSALAYQGDYGISTNPESFVATPYQMYFTDATRGQVLRATTEGIVSISDKGMKDYFADICSSGINQMVGTHDERKKEYNLSILKTNDTWQVDWNDDSTTVSYSEYSKGWTSFKSFIPQGGLSINNKYFTFYNGHIWEHYTNDLHNDFYGTDYPSSITTILNDNPGSVKSFGTINYEGSQAKVTQFALMPFPILTGDITEGADGVGSTNTTDGEYFNLVAASGWQVDSIITDQQTCGNIEFKDKEGKWFGYPSGETTTLDNLDEKEFTVQGLGTGGMTHSDPSSVGVVIVTVDE